MVRGILKIYLQVVFFLSGLTCTDENFIQKSGAQRVANEKGIALIAPDTSPRGLGIDGEDDSWDFGTGTHAPWLGHENENVSFVPAVKVVFFLDMLARSSQDVLSLLV